ncbi:MAG: hypothetical protein HZB92_06445 [Euryarchaeota archaeon]|nr:hypothetical protein [Euryarchaeota archaeon]
MPEIILFTKKDCQKCDYVKGKIPEGLELRVLDMESVEGTAEAAYYELIGKNTPILVVDGEVVESAIDIKNRMAELAARK